MQSTMPSLDLTKPGTARNPFLQPDKHDFRSDSGLIILKPWTADTKKKQREHDRLVFSQHADLMNCQHEGFEEPHLQQRKQIPK